MKYDFIRMPSSTAHDPVYSIKCPTCENMQLWVGQESCRYCGITFSMFTQAGGRGKHAPQKEP